MGGGDRRAGADIPAGAARDHIAGYTIFNDFSARDEQTKAMRSLLGPDKGKDLDTGNALGPWLVTRDEIPQPYGLTMTARVNGAQWSHGSTGDMHWTFEDLIAEISRSETPAGRRRDRFRHRRPGLRARARRIPETR